MSFLDFYEYSLIGLLLGGLYALIGLGFVLVYKATRVLNFAMGEFMMMGACCNQVEMSPGLQSRNVTKCAEGSKA